MSASLVGAIVGFVIGLTGFLFIRLAAARVESKGVTAEPQKTAAVLRVVAIADLIIFTVLGFFIGPMIASNAGN